MILDSFCVWYRPFMRPLERPTKHFWIKVFQWPLIEAKRGQRQKWPKRSNFEILLWISYMRITKSQKLSKNSSWKRLQWLWKFNIYTRVGSMHFWLILVNDLSWGQTKAWPEISLLKSIKKGLINDLKDNFGYFKVYK